MRTSLLLVLVLAGGAAAENAPKRKTAPDRFAKAAGEAFVAATAADQRGDLPTALGLYQKAFAISPHPSTIYNIADVERRLGRLADSIHSYETYLAIMPDASDRKIVEAVLEKLQATPGSVFVVSGVASDPRSIDLATAYILFDGKIMVKPGTKQTQAVDGGPNPGFELTVPPGDYDLDAITPLTYGISHCKVRPGERVVCHVSAPPRIDGNVVISGADEHLTILVERQEKRRNATRMQKRIELPPGRTRLFVRDGSYECPPLALDAPRGGDVAYSYIDDVERTSVPRCRTHVITQHRLKFEP